MAKKRLLSVGAFSPFGAKPYRAAVFAIGAVALFLFVHPDAIETGNHAYLLLESIFSGQPRSFYGLVAAHQNNLYYINNAHYNIVVYLLFALAELPVFAVNTLFHLPVNEAVLTFIVKAVNAAFFVGCMPVMVSLARELKYSQTAQSFAPLLFALWPPALFSALVMGQFDVIALFFVLSGLLYWMRGKVLEFSLLFGFAIAIKSLPAFLFLPLLLLIEKRPLQILRQGLTALWLTVPTTLLFVEVTFSMKHFNEIMTERLFAAKLAGGREIAVFPLLFALLCVLAFFWHPAPQNRNKAGLWMGLCVRGVLFLFVEWHPQWLILLAPFMILTTLAESHRRPWLFVDLVFFAGFFLLCAAAYPSQLEANLFDAGLLGLFSQASSARTPLIELYLRVPMLARLPMVLFSAALGAQLLLKAPLCGGQTIAGRLQSANGACAAEEEKEEQVLKQSLFASLCAGFVFWLLPVLATRLFG